MKRGGAFAWRGTVAALALLIASAIPSHAADPPLLYLDEARAVGHVLDAPDGTPRLVTFDLCDSLGVGPGCCDTIPKDSELTFRWHAVPSPGGTITGYMYRVGMDWVTVDPNVTSVVFDAGAWRVGWHEFTLRVTTTNDLESEIRRYFHLGIAPDSWLAGPDPAAAPGGSVALDQVATLGGLFGCDSLTVRPGMRPARRTFTEIYGDRAYVRAEGDTVHMNSWVVLHAGGWDPDSPYHVPIGAGDPALLDTLSCGSPGVPEVVHDAGLVGSPVGFRYLHGVLLSPAGPYGVPAASFVMPNFDPSSVFRAPTVAGYPLFRRSGRVYLGVASEDGDGLLDRRIFSAGVLRGIVDRVESGTATPEDLALRPLILTFHVNRAPYLLVGDPAFVPKPGHAFPTRTLALDLIARDDDPFDAGGTSPPGGPTPTGMLRWSVRLRGADADGRDTVVTVPGMPVLQPSVTVDVPDVLVGPDVAVEVELCDCITCEATPGQGRCATWTIPIVVPSSIPTPALAALIGASATPDRVRLSWWLGRADRATVERADAAAAWRALETVRADGARMVAFEDHSVTPGARYGYRLALDTDAGRITAAETWVEVPAAVLALDPTPNPTTGGTLVVRFSLPRAAPARIEMFDLSGRRVAARDVGGMGAGRHAIDLGAGARIGPGVYVIRLAQGGEMRARRLAVLK